MSEIKDVWDALAVPFTADQIKQRPGRGGMTFDYVDARDVMNRLDLVLGPEHWQFGVEAIGTDGVSRGRLSVQLDDGSWVHREDFGYPNSDDDEEPYKSSASDALKRCAVHFGVGRHLYDKDKSARPRPASAPRSAPRPSQAAARPAQTDREGTPLDVCPVHRERWQHKVGTSKAGKAYDFWGCPSKEGGTFCRERPDKAFLDGIAEAVADELGDDLANIPF